jgi:hypothetical protein
MKKMVKFFVAALFLLSVATAERARAQSMDVFLQGLNRQMSDAMRTATNTVEQNQEMARRYNRWTNQYSGYVASEEARTRSYQAYQQQQYRKAYYEARSNYYYCLQYYPEYAAYYARQMKLYRPYVSE